MAQAEENYVSVTPHGPESTREPFRFILAGKKFELPALDSASIPLGLVPVFLAINDDGKMSDTDKTRIAGLFIEYIQHEEPQIYRTIKAQRDPIRWILGLLLQWGEHSKLDPKAPSSGD